MDIAVAGSEDFVQGFKLAGVRRIHEAPQDELEKTISSLLSDSSIGVLVVLDDDICNFSASFRRKMYENISPVVISIGNIDYSDLGEKIKRIIGLDLYSKKDE